jgi:hypothetical protein
MRFSFYNLTEFFSLKAVLTAKQLLLFSSPQFGSTMLHLLSPLQQIAVFATHLL